MNIKQTRQHELLLLHWDATTKELYWKVFMTYKWPENYRDLLDTTDAEKAKKGYIYH